jgi:phenylacetate-CoA ligase
VWLPHRVFAQNVRDMRRMPVAQVEAAAHALLCRLLRHAAGLVPFYRSAARTLEAAADGDRAAWAALPVLTGDDLRRLGPEGLASELPDGEEALPLSRTWTSLSTPIDGPLGVLGEIADKAQWEFLAYSAGIDTTGRLAAILPSTALQPRDLAEAFEPWSIDAHAGRANRWCDELDPASTVAWLENVQPSCLFAEPGSMERLLSFADPGRLAVKDILVWRPARTAGFASECRRAFGARVSEVVASSLLGFTASASRSGRFVPALESAYVEIIDADGQHCDPGKAGRLVVTALYAYYRPVIRHDVGLSAVWDEIEALDPLSPERPSFQLVR